MNVVDLGSYTSDLLRMLLRKPQIKEQRVHFLQSVWTLADFFNILSQVVGDVTNKDSLERNLYLSILRCVVARRRKETPQLFECYYGMCWGVLVPHRCLKQAAICSPLSNWSAFGHIQKQDFKYAAPCFTSRTAEGPRSHFQPATHDPCGCGCGFAWSPNRTSSQPSAVRFEPLFCRSLRDRDSFQCLNHTVFSSVSSPCCPVASSSALFPTTTPSSCELLDC